MAIFSGAAIALGAKTLFSKYGKVVLPALFIGAAWWVVSGVYEDRGYAKGYAKYTELWTQVKEREVQWKERLNAKDKQYATLANEAQIEIVKRDAKLKAERKEFRKERSAILADLNDTRASLGLLSLLDRSAGVRVPPVASSTRGLDEASGAITTTLADTFVIVSENYVLAEDRRLQILDLQKYITNLCNTYGCTPPPKGK